MVNFGPKPVFLAKNEEASRRIRRLWLFRRNTGLCQGLIRLLNKLLSVGQITKYLRHHYKAILRQFLVKNRLLLSNKNLFGICRAFRGLWVMAYQPLNRFLRHQRTRLCGAVLVISIIYALKIDFTPKMVCFLKSKKWCITY